MILVTGANGMVGSYVREIFKGEDLYLTDLPELDITNKEQVFGMIKRVKPSLVIHLAAETDVDKCEQAVDHAYRTNTLGTQNVALACQRADCEMVYISTGAVFGGGPGEIHTEFSPTNPRNVYARSKLEGEKIVQDLLTRYYIFRAGWMIGGGRQKDIKFVGKIIQFCLEGRREIKAVSDKYGTPTFARDLVGGIKELIKTGNYGVYHLGNNGCCTRYDIAKKIIEILGLDIKLTSVSSAEFPLPAPRAESEGIRNYKLELLGLNVMRNWEAALAEYVNGWRQNA
ncbi:MAG: sugar nucleotide-binding protein [Candidatus Margulisbacteria bacterium]|nr:sugar nucleotide-binding protein [Candidatus Margulisiibacteriota bacterium]